jgi:Fe-S-cluster-containing hydrogenase component 2
VRAIEEDEGVFRVDSRRCIGCGLCLSACPPEAIRMVPKQPEDLAPSPKDEVQWVEMQQRSRSTALPGDA